MEDSPLAQEVREILIRAVKRFLASRKLALQQVAQEMGVTLSDHDIQQIEELYPHLLNAKEYKKAIELYVEGR